jgi:chromosomal replication initiation ATPase DnaA
MSDQLILKFPSHQAYKKEDFYVSPSNQKAYDFINSWPKWIKRTVNIFGPSGSGKSHLASILKSKTSCLQIETKKLSDEIFFKFKTKETLIIENLDRKVSEKLLFSLWNIALQDNKYLLITSKKPINSVKFKLRDLTSRVTSSIIIGINLPSDDLISVILAKNFSDKQIKVEKKHIDYIMKRIDRSYEKISQFILTLDKYS